MSLMQELMEMDPFMRPIGGLVKQSTPAVDSQNAQPNRRYKNLLAYLQHRATAEDEEETFNLKNEIFSFLQNNEQPSEKDYENFAQSLGVDVERVCSEIYNLAREVVLASNNEENVEPFADDEFADDEFADDEFADDEFADDEFEDNRLNGSTM